MTTAIAKIKYKKTGWEWMPETDTVDNTSYRQLSGGSNKVSGRQLRKLRLAGIIEQKNSGKYTYYVPGKEFLSTLPEEALSTQFRTLSSQPGALSSQLEMIRNSLPDILLKKLDTLGARSKNAGIASELIEELCRIRPFTVSELAMLQQRHEKHIKQNYLSPLMKAGKIRFTIPEIPHHPDQKYSSNK